MVRRLFIVARGNPVLYEDLAQQFAHEKNVEIILDRRLGERRQRVQAHAFERRRAERRRQPGLDDELRSHGFVFIRCEDN